MHRHTTDTVLMVRPASFGWNPETASSNTFQASPSPVSAQCAALGEFDRTVAALQSAGIKVMVVDDHEESHLPDAVFPNNWMTTHDDGQILLYPMASPIRRGERRQEIIDALRRQFVVTDVVDLTRAEQFGMYLEGTGSLVLDRRSRRAFACRSPRTDAQLVRDWCEMFGYRATVFDASVDGQPVYHTNVLLTIGTKCAIVCSEWIAEQDREQVLKLLRDDGHDVVEVTDAEARAYCANCLELSSPDGPVLAGSWQLEGGEDERFRDRVAPFFEQIVGPPVPTIWSQGGGGVRCMICEVFLERK